MLLFHNNQKYYHDEFPCIFCNEYIYYFYFINKKTYDFVLTVIQKPKTFRLL